MFAKRLERGRVIRPATVDGVVTITGYLPEGIDWRTPQHWVATRSRRLTSAR
jgi:hypothetical protein